MRCDLACRFPDLAVEQLVPMQLSELEAQARAEQLVSVLGDQVQGIAPLEMQVGAGRASAAARVPGWHAAAARAQVHGPGMEGG